MTSGRYQVTVTTGGVPLIQGWWGSETTARRKFASWVGEHGSRVGARVTLTDEATDAVLTEWPDAR